MSILPRLMKAYKDQGLMPLTGYSPAHFGGFPDAHFTCFINPDKTIVGVMGLALQELMFMEPLGAMLSPKNILVIGNALGWSTIALGMIFPHARIVSIDPNQDGNALTNRIARACGLNIKAEAGFSPGDVELMAVRHLGGKVDLFLIDAIHSNEAVIVDFSACRTVAAEDAVYIFHDVINCGLVDAINHIRRSSGLTTQVLTRTPSGMAVAYGTVPQEVAEYVACFTDDNLNAYRAYRTAAMEAHGKLATATSLDPLGEHIAKL